MTASQVTGESLTSPKGEETTAGLPGGVLKLETIPSFLFPVFCLKSCSLGQGVFRVVVWSDEYAYRIPNPIRNLSTPR